MALMHTPVCEFGSAAPDFRLRDFNGKEFSLADCRGERASLVMFICNHCPYVKAIIKPLLADVRDLQAEKIGVVAIMPNDYRRYAEDAPERMRDFAATHGFTFPYLIDETQEVARAYGAVCTPDFFGYDRDLRLQYRGRLDATTPTHPPTANMKRELREAMLAIAAGKSGPRDQTPSMGCSIKWK
ncbi:MAG: thioredoxin family protein [Gammaproteobacteria bacterium]